MATTVLSVNVNKIALLRNSRGAKNPDVLAFAQTAIEAGAQGITVHPRPDGRHVRPDDVEGLAESIAVELNIEGYPSEAFLDLVCRVQPAQCTLVPDDPGQLTSDHGWDVARHKEQLRRTVERLHEKGVRVSLFMDPDPASMSAAAATGADRIELYTEGWAQAYASGSYATELDRYVRAAQAAEAAGLGVNAGHDLDAENVGPFLGAIPNVLEASIGHALVCDALREGWEPAVRRYRAAIAAA